MSEARLNILGCLQKALERYISVLESYDAHVSSALEPDPCNTPGFGAGLSSSSSGGRTLAGQVASAMCVPAAAAAAAAPDCAQPGPGFLSSEACFQDYQTLDSVLDTLGEINDMIVERFRPDSRGSEYVYGRGMIKHHIKPLYNKLIVRWAVSGLGPAVRFGYSYSATHALALQEEEEDSGKTDKDEYRITRTTLFPPRSESYHAPTRAPGFGSPPCVVSVSEQMWMSGKKEWREYVLWKMVRRVNRVLLETVLFMSEETVEGRKVFGSGLYGEDGEGFQRLRASVVKEYGMFLGLGQEESEAQTDVGTVLVVI